MLVRSWVTVVRRGSHQLRGSLLINEDVEYMKQRLAFTVRAQNSALKLKILRSLYSVFFKYCGLRRLRYQQSSIKFRSLLKYIRIHKSYKILSLITCVIRILWLITSVIRIYCMTDYQCDKDYILCISALDHIQSDSAKYVWQN